MTAIRGIVHGILGEKKNINFDSANNAIREMIGHILLYAGGSYCMSQRNTIIQLPSRTAHPET
jgi:hypothetical protein